VAHYLESLLPVVEKPARYLGGEVNAARKNRGDCDFSFCLAFPDVYEVGMSHLGLSVLYGILNGEKKVIAERCFAPWWDMELLMRRKGLLLSSLESQIPLREFDMVGFSLQYELSYTNVLAMLDLGGIPIRRRDRRDEDPIVCAGGPCAFNPNPMADFIDVFAIGEGEDLVLEMARTYLEGKKKGKGRREILELLARIEGLYCPGIHDGKTRVKKRVVMDLNDSFFPTAPPVPLMKAIHDRITIEIARGCTRGCRFCQAGMVWRPVRERHPEIVEMLTESLVASTGQEEISLLALSAGDYSFISELIASLVQRYYNRRIALALPSLRVETLKGELIEEVKKVRKTSFTLAPEAGTQRLRDIVNKCNTEEDLIATVKKVFEAGWRSVKLYFMIGLPGETKRDLYGIGDLVHRLLEETKRGGGITVSVSTFVPKAHTPFQWEAQIGWEETSERQELLKSILRHRRLEFRWHDPRMSLLEGLFSRGEEDMGRLVEKAFILGCRFDGWAERFRFDLWQRAMDELGIVPEKILATRPLDANLPWDFIDCGLKKEFLLTELMRAQRGELTPDCRLDGCYGCGVCDGLSIRPVEANRLAEKSTSPCQAREEKLELCRYRFLFTKGEAMRFLSHLDVAALLQRSFSRVGLPLLFTEGFHPHPRISFAYATPVGMESEGEYGEMLLRYALDEVDSLPPKINRFLPTGIEVKWIRRVPNEGPSLTESIDYFTFSAPLIGWSSSRREELKEKIKDFLSVEKFEIIRHRKNKEERRDIRPLVRDIYLNPQEEKLIMELFFTARGMVSPFHLLHEVLGLPLEDVKSVKIKKEATSFKLSY